MNAPTPSHLRPHEPMDDVAAPVQAVRAALAARRHLAVTAGPDAGWVHPLDGPRVVVGRDPSCDLTVHDVRLSRRHLEARLRRGTVEVRDLGSANGTLVRPAGARGVRWPRARPLGRRWRRLAPGRELLAGHTVVRVRARPGLAEDGARRRTARRRDRDAVVPTSDRDDVGTSAGASAEGGRGVARALTTVVLACSSLPFLLTTGVTGLRLAFLLLLPLVLVILAAAGPVRDAIRARLRPKPSATDPAFVLLAAASGGGRESAQHGPSPTSAGTPDRTLPPVLLDGETNPFRDGPVALVGEPGLVRAHARRLICDVATRSRADDLAIRVRSADAGAWSWAGRLPHADAVEAATPCLEVIDMLDHGSADALLDGPASGGRPCGVVVLVDRLARTPATCRRVIEVGPATPAAVSLAWAQVVATVLAGTGSATRCLPADTTIDGLLPDPGRAWPASDGRLGAVFTIGPEGPVEVDLARDGPHALVAGTTGAGKSESLVCWVLALASRYPPSDLTIVGFDYKGGATLLPIADLPHVAGILTDLDAGGTVRALDGLRAELVRREGLLAAVGARDLAHYRSLASRDHAPAAAPARLGRLLVVVDEFRTLADEHPDLLASLIRLAAQGRSLGMHLILATQRPGGAVGADLRANLTVALCLRVLSAADSLDVVGVPDAARLPRIPGRAVLAGVSGAGDGSPTHVQSAWCGTDGAAVRNAVARLRRAAEAAGERAAEPLWAPPLPERAVASGPESSDPGGPGRDPDGPAPSDPPVRLPLLLLDGAPPLGHSPWSWAPSSGPLLVAGGTRTGRSTALLTLASGALARGLPVHLAGRDTALPPAITDHPFLGTVVGVGDPRRLARLLDLLAFGTGPALLCLDDVDAVLEACERAHPSGGPERLARLLRDGPSAGVWVAAAGPSSTLLARWSSPIRRRLVLAPSDAGDAALAGIPRGLLAATTRWPPGRGVLVGDGAPVLAQVFLPGPATTETGTATATARTRTGTGTGTPAGTGTAAGTATGSAPGAPTRLRGDGAILRLEPIPTRVPPSRLRALDPVLTDPDGREVILALGGDDARPVAVDLGPGARLVVAGPPHSGRTATLDWIAERLASRGLAVTRLGPRSGDVPDVGGDGVRVGGGAPSPAAAALLVDDADLLEAGAATRVAEAWRGSAGVVVAVTRSEPLAAAYHGLLGLLRESRAAVVLAPLRGGTAHLTAADVLPHADPAHPRHPGRGVLVEPHRSVPLQVPLPEVT